MMIVPGKDLLALLRAEIQERWHVNLTDARIVAEFRPEEVAPDLRQLIGELDSYRAGKTK